MLSASAKHCVRMHESLAMIDAWKGSGQVKDYQIEIEALLAAIMAYLLDHCLAAIKIRQFAWPPGAPAR